MVVGTGTRRGRPARQLTTEATAMDEATAQVDAINSLANEGMELLVRATADRMGVSYSEATAYLNGPLDDYSRDDPIYLAYANFNNIDSMTVVDSE